jgi:hypothetical protein
VNSTLRWEDCIVQRDEHVLVFIENFLAQPKRRALLIAGAGFDPRATHVCEILASHMRDRLTVVLLREERPNSNQRLREGANENLAKMTSRVDRLTVSEVRIFASDNAVIGGREAVKAVASVRLSDFTDILLDCSALSRGVFFPIVKFLLPKDDCKNLHLFVIDQAALDEDICPVVWEQAGNIHGFKGNLSVSGPVRPAARLWLPQLVTGQKTALDLIYQMVQPHDVCPILPFPATDPRQPDRLIEAYATEMENRWQVDPRNIVYADEHNPLDLYRAIMRIHEARKVIFHNFGSQIVLSPIGSKILSLGALMAALEQDFPVVYVEAVDYEINLQKASQDEQQHGSLVHMWLKGEAYDQSNSHQAQTG